MMVLLPLVSAVEAAEGDDVYYYNRGQLAAKRIREPALNEQQIQKAIEGFAAQLRGHDSAYSASEIREAVNQHQLQRRENRDEIAQQNMQQGDAYLAALEDDAAYRFLDQGLAYKVVKQGAGGIPKAASQVRLNYIGRHLDGREFDAGSMPAWLSLQSVLPGWRMALLKMPAGSQWTIVVPAHLAYGERGAGTRVGPQETLIFDISLLEVR